MHKTHKNHHFTSQFCHCERSSAIHITSPCSQGEDRRGSTMQTPHHPQSGRSMVEMLGSMAIMGVLSVGAIGGYSYAMNKHRTNELIYEATKRAQWVGTQLEMNKNAQNIGFGGFGTDTFSGGKFTGTVKTDLANPNQFGIAVSELKEGVCKNIIKGLETETNGVIRAVLTTDGTSDFNRSNCVDDAAFLLVFNRDLSANDTPISASDPEVSGEATGPATATAQATTTGPSDRVTHCNDHGDWDGSSCDCDAGFEGNDCSIDINDPCSGHGIWIVSTDNLAGGFCECYRGWGGSNCSEDSQVACGNYGTWNGRVCTCNSGWGGNDCSIPNACSGHGSWYAPDNGEDPYCGCNSGWGGSDCSEMVCSGNGSWNTWLNNGAGGCSCNNNWGGSDCSEDHTNDCNGHGSWSQSRNNGAGGCSCQSGWVGSDCSEIVCSGHGRLSGNSCSCNSGWGGSDCSEDKSNACSGHGTWYQSNNNGAGGCSCYNNWSGSDCSEDHTNDCSGHGSWSQSKNNGSGGCTCSSGWGGSDCSEEPCSGNGTWSPWFNDGVGGCYCDSGYTGADCSTPN